jgi:TatA/E family protein of Tat protein translocase
MEYMGFGELIVLLIVVLLFFGAGRLPAVGAGLGKAIRGFKDAVWPPATGPTPPPPARPKQLRGEGGAPE